VAIKIGEAFVEFFAKRSKQFDQVAAAVKKQSLDAAKASSQSATAAGANVGPAKTAAQAWNEMLAAGEKLAPVAGEVAQSGMAAAEGVGALGAGAAAAAGPIGIAVAVGASFLVVLGKLLPAIHAAAEELKNMKVAADVAGYSTRELSATAYAMEKAGGSLNEFLSMRKAWNDQALDLSYGVGHAGTAMRILGVSATDARGKLRTIENVLPDIGRAMERFNAVDRAKLSDALFGGGGDGFLKLLAQGNKSLESMKINAEALGLTANKATSDAGSQLADVWSTLGGELKALWRNLAAALSPVLVPLLAEFVLALAGLNRLLAGLNTLFIAPFTRVCNMLMSTFTYIAKVIDAANKKLGKSPGARTASFILDPLNLLGLRNDDAAAGGSKSLGLNQLSALQGGGFAATLGGLTEFARNMVQTAAGRSNIGEQQLAELKNHTQLLGQIAGSPLGNPTFGP